MKQLEFPTKTNLMMTGIIMCLFFVFLCFIVQLPQANSQETAWLMQVHGYYADYDATLSSISIFLAYVGGAPVSGALVLLLCAMAYVKKRGDLSLFAGIAFVGAVAIGWLFKEIIARPRPLVWEQVAPYFGYSFPSNHSMYAMVLAGILIVFSWKSDWQKFTLIFGVVWCLLMGLSRVYLGAHFPTDVIGGLSLGLIWLCLVTWLFIYFNIFQHRASNTAGNHEVKL